MIDCYQEGGQDKEGIWVTCEVCGFSKYIQEFTIYIMLLNLVEVCNSCYKKKQ